MILRKAVDYFARHGFNGSTRDLANQLGVTQSLLYRYFPTKQALLDKVYEEVYLSRWNPFWEELLRDRGIPVQERLTRYYLDYARIVLRNEWVRILIFAGLQKEGINNRLFKLLRERIFVVVVQEVMVDMGIEPEQPFPAEAYELELELVWALHASIFYIGMRRWVYGAQVPKDVPATIEALVQSFLLGLRARIAERKARPTAG